MALSIKDDRTDDLVRRYAKLKRTSFTKAIRLAVSDALRREGESVEDGESDFLTAVRELQERVAALPTLDGRTADEIIGYDETGLPA